jgi:hypothetical protein
LGRTLASTPFLEEKVEKIKLINEGFIPHLRRDKNTE